MAGVSARRTACTSGEAEVLREDTGQGTAAARRGTGPRTSTAMEERTSGRASAQQGARGTRHRLPDQAIGRRPGEGGGLAHEPGVATRAGSCWPRSWGHDSRRGHTPRRRRGSRASEGQVGDTTRDFGLDAGGQRSRWLAVQYTRRMRGGCERARQPPGGRAGCVARRPTHHWLPTGLGKADGPGCEGGLRKRGLWRHEAPTSPIERARVGNSPPKVIRAVFLPDGSGR